MFLYANILFIMSSLFCLFPSQRFKHVTVSIFVSVFVNNWPVDCSTYFFIYVFIEIFVSIFYSNAHSVNILFTQWFFVFVLFCHSTNFFSVRFFPFVYCFKLISLSHQHSSPTLPPKPIICFIQSPILPKWYAFYPNPSI